MTKRKIPPHDGSQNRPPQADRPDGENAGLGQINHHSGPWPCIGVFVVLGLLWLFCFSNALHSGFSLVDDGTYNWEAQQVLAQPGIVNKVRSVWYSPTMQGGGRYVPVFNIVRATHLWMFGYEPYWHHLAYLLYSWLPIGVGGLWLSLLTRRAYIQVIPFLIYLSTGDIGFGSLFVNIFDVASYDTLAAMGLITFLVGAERYLRGHDGVASWAWLLLALVGGGIATHAKETGAMVFAVSIPVLATVWVLRSFPRRRIAVLFICALTILMLFAWGVFQSGAYAASRVNPYTSGFSPNWETMSRNLGVASIYYHQTTGPLFWLILFASCGRVCFVTWRRFVGPHCQDISVFDGLLSVFLFCFVAALLSVLPVTFLQSAPRFYHVSSIFLGFMGTLTLLFLPQWMGACAVHFQREAKPFRVATQAIVALACLIFLSIPLRVHSMSGFYLLDWSAHYRAAEIARDYMEMHPSRRLIVMQADDRAPFRWGVFNHVRNMGIARPLERIEFVEVSSLLDRSKQFDEPRLGILLGRTATESQRALAAEGIREATPVEPRRITTFRHTSWQSIVSWIRRKGPSPLTPTDYQTGVYVVLLYD